MKVTVRNEVEAIGQMREDQEIFLVIRAGKNAVTGGNHHRVSGVLRRGPDGTWIATFDPFHSPYPDPPKLVNDPSFHGVYFSFKGATLTAKAFDLTLAGLGIWIVPAVAWMFAFSTIISWSYYGEQGVIYLFGNPGVMPYRVVYCLLILLSATPLIRTERELDVISTLGTGVMLWANIPIMLLFGNQAMRAYHRYMNRLKRGEFGR